MSAQVAPDGTGLGGQEPVVEPLVVAEIETLLLQFPFEVPVRLGDLAPSRDGVGAGRR